MAVVIILLFIFALFLVGSAQAIVYINREIREAKRLDIDALRLFEEADAWRKEERMQKLAAREQTLTEKSLKQAEKEKKRRVKPAES